MARRNPNGMYVAKRALREQFDPHIYQKETYLLCHLRWGNSKACWIHWVRNDNDNDNNCHAEVYFLEKIFELRSSNFCDITWYLSWSPCATCCYRIRNFLERHRNVNIDIRVARLYETYRPETRRGLRELASLQHRVTIGVMDIEDYRYCWKTFIQKGVGYDFLPMDFKPAITRNRGRLNNILTREKFVDFYLELQSHLRNPPPDSFLTWI